MKSIEKKVNQKQIDSDYRWIMMQSLSAYKGQWIAVLENKIIARNESLKEVQNKIATLDLKNVPLYLRVPEGSITE